MPYITNTPDQYNPKRTNTVTDLPRFAADIAKELGGRVLPPEGEGPHYPNESQTIDLGDNTHLHLYANRYRYEGRVVFSIRAADVKTDDRNSYAKEHKTSEAAVSPDGRPIAAIARDIKKRVIDANAPALAAQRAYRDQRQAGAAKLAKTCASLRIAFPRAEFRFDQKEQRGHLYANGGDYYVSGTFYAEGNVSLDRVTISAGPLAALLRALDLHKPPKATDA